ncbi:hypothetical protein Tco_0575815 [Tanacetum coccineum]
MNSLRELFKDFDNGLHLELNEVKTVFNQMEAVVEQCSVDKKSAIVDYKSMEKSSVDEYNESLELKTELSKKKDMIEQAVFQELSNKYSQLEQHCISLEIAMQQNLQPLSSILRKNKEVHEDYLKITKEHTVTLCEIVEQARALKPSNNALDFACQYTQHIQELLVCVNASCPSSQKDSAKTVAAKTKNRNRRVTFEEKCDTSATTAQKQAAL